VAQWVRYVRTYLIQQWELIEEVWDEDVRRVVT
jgi:hypothetical protein